MYSRREGRRRLTKIGGTDRKEVRRDGVIKKEMGRRYNHTREENEGEERGREREIIRRVKVGK